MPEFDFGPDGPVPSPGAPAARQATVKPRTLVIFASFFAFMAVALIGVWLGFGPDLLQLKNRLLLADVASGPVAPNGLLVNACPLQPAVTAAGAKDGQFPLQENVSGLTAADIGSFLVIGKQSALAGRPRDAEVAFLMACRVADKLKGSGSIEAADARFQLGAHYGALALAASTAPGLERNELLQRAEGLYTDSLPAYVAKFGSSGEQPKQAGEGLSAVRLALAQIPPQPQPQPQPRPPLQPQPEQQLARDTEPARDRPVVQPPVAGSSGQAIRLGEATAPRPDAVPRLEPRKNESESEVAREVQDSPPTPREPSASGGSGPSFDCRRARSKTEKMICADSELSRLDRELGRAYGRAKNATADPAAFRRHSEMEWRRRESICQDRGCLLRWYAYRRAQLVSVIEGREPAPQVELR